jgi:ribosome-binding factor A
MATSRRIFRVGEKIRNLIALQLHRTADPRFLLVTITSVVVSKDLQHAKVYWMVSGDKSRIAEVEEAFASSAGLFRRAVGQELGVRFVPEVRFYYDETLDTNERVLELLSRIKKPESEEPGE